MGDVLKQPPQWRQSLMGFLVLAVLCLFAPSAIAADDEAAGNAIDLALQAADLAGGPSLSTEERAVVKTVMTCAIDGSSLEACGRKVLVGQLGKLPAPASDLADCLLKGGKVEDCGQQAVVKSLVPSDPPGLQQAANCLADAAINGGAADDCVRKAVVGAISDKDKSVGQIADCLLQQRPVAECASGALMSQISANLGPDAGAAATCLIQKQDPTQCTAELARAGGLGTLPPEVTCISNKNQAAIQACLQQSIVDRLPGDQRQKDLAKCMLDPAQAQTCAKDQLTAALPPGVADAANCISTAQNPATCTGKVAKGAGLGDALDALSKTMSSTKLVDPGHAPSSLANLLLVAKGIRDGQWGDVIEYGGAELYKAAGKIVLDVVIPIPGLSALAGPIMDTMVQNRLDLVNELLKEAKKCSKLDPSQCDTAKMGEILGEFYMLMQIEIPCTVLGEMSPKVQEVTCGPLGDAIQAVGSTAYDIYKDNDKTLAGIAYVLFPGSGIAEAIVALDPDFQNAVIGKHGECPANYFSSHIVVCVKDVAYLGMVDPSRAADLTKSVNDTCHQDFKDCSQRNAVGKGVECAGDVVGDLLHGKAPSCHVDDSDRIAKQCDPAMQALKSAADDLRNRAEALAAEYAATDSIPTPKDACAPIDTVINGFVARCTAALPAKLPGIDGGNFAACNVPGRNLPPADLFGAACRAAAMDKIREQRRPILVAKGIQPDQSPEAIDNQFNTLCSSCEIYGSRAVYQAKQNADTQCGGVGPRWTTNFMDHKLWCLTAPDAAVKAEDQARQDELQTCLTCQDYANRAMKGARTNVAYNCGGVGPRYTLDFAAHVKFCQSAQPFQMQQEQDARTQFLDQCVKDYVKANAPAVTATPDCVPVTVVNPATCNDPNQRRGADGVCFSCSPDQHFDETGRCALCSSGFHAINGDVCVSDRAQPVIPPCAVSSPPRLPVLPLPLPIVTCPGDLKLVGTQCICPPGTIRTADNRCTQPAASSPVICPAGQMPGADGACRCPDGALPQNGVCIARTSCAPPAFIGADNQCHCPDGDILQGNRCVQAPCQPSQRRGADGVCFSCSHNDHFDASGRCVPCPVGSHVQGDQCVPEKAPAAGGTNGTSNLGPCKDPSQRRGADGVCFSCSHNDHFDANGRCVPCSPGFHVQGDQCVPDKAPATGGTSGTSNLGPCKDPNQRRGPDGVCFSCSHNDHFDANGRCVPCSPGFHVQGDQCVPDQQPTKCPLGQLGTLPNCKCPLGMTGTPPNCCPPGTLFQNGQCAQPQTTQTKHDCPPGYKVLDKPNKYGAFCEAPATCDTSKGEILYPDGQCSCPPGQGRYGPNRSCAPPPAQPTPTGPAPKHICPAGSFGTYPDCHKPGDPCGAGGSYDNQGNCTEFCPHGKDPNGACHVG